MAYNPSPAPGFINRCPGQEYKSYDFDPRKRYNWIKPKQCNLARNKTSHIFECCIISLQSCVTPLFISVTKLHNTLYSNADLMTNIWTSGHLDIWTNTQLYIIDIYIYIYIDIFQLFEIVDFFGYFNMLPLKIGYRYQNEVKLFG